MNLISETYTKIFQALIVLINEHHLNDDMVLSSIELDKTNIRSREFEIRLHRMIFEAKQKILVLKGIMVKHKLHDSNKTKDRTHKALYQSLRCYSSVLTAYLNHLPLSGRQLFPSALQSLFEQLNTLGHLAKELNFQIADQTTSDTHRLSAVYNQFQPKFRRNDEEFISKSPSSKMFGSEKNLKIIKNLTNEKFGNPPSALNLSSLRSPRRESNLKRDAMMNSGRAITTHRTFSGLRIKQKEIIPKPTKLLQDRVKHRKQKIYGDEAYKDDITNQDEIREAFDGMVRQNEIEGGMSNHKVNDQRNESSRRLSRISVSTHSHVDLDENVLSFHSPRPPPSMRNDTKHHNVQYNRNTSPTKTTSSSLHCQTASRHDSMNKESQVHKLSRQSTISPLKDEDYFTDIPNQSGKSRNGGSTQREEVEEEDIEKEDSIVRQQIRTAGFGNVLAFTSNDKLKSLDRFSRRPNAPIINESIVKGNYLQRQGRRYIEISHDELNDILSHKERFEREQANSHFTSHLKKGKFNLQNENPFKFICSVSAKVTEEIIENICHEMATSHIVNDLIQKELQI